MMCVSSTLSMKSQITCTDYNIVQSHIDTLNATNQCNNFSVWVVPDSGIAIITAGTNAYSLNNQYYSGAIYIRDQQNFTFGGVTGTISQWPHLSGGWVTWNYIDTIRYDVEICMCPNSADTAMDSIMFHVSLTIGEVYGSWWLQYDLAYLLKVYHRFDSPCQTTAATEAQGRDEITIYPNPTQGMVQISHFPDDATVTVTDGLGRVVWTGSENRIDLSGQPAGLYFLTVATPSGRITEKVIKE